MPLILARASLRPITIITIIIMTMLIAPTLRIVSLVRPRLPRGYKHMTRINTMSTADICTRLIRRC